jgi:hypothetical protein
MSVVCIALNLFCKGSGFFCQASKGLAFPDLYILLFPGTKIVNKNPECAGVSEQD